MKVLQRSMQASKVLQSAQRDMPGLRHKRPGGLAAACYNTTAAGCAVILPRKVERTAGALSGPRAVAFGGREVCARKRRRRVCVGALCGWCSSVRLQGVRARPQAPLKGQGLFPKEGG